MDQWDHVVNFGLQAFCKTWLIDYFDEHFFELPENEVVSSYKRVMDTTMAMGQNICDYEKIRKLHQLGYLPVEIFSLPEGARVPMHCPIFGITYTHPNFAWLPQALESLISAELWYPMICATVGYTYRKIVNIAFACLAIDAGMDSAVMDPLSRDLRGAIYAAEALIGEDYMCMEYIGAFREDIFGPQK